MISIFIALSAAFLLIFLYFYIKKSNINSVIIFICSCTLIYFVTFPKQCIHSTIFGAKIFFTAVFPSLFPFLIICNILIAFDGISIYSKYLGKLLCRPLRLPLQCSLTLIISSLCGYPLGAKYSCELYENNLITKQDCQRLLNIASNTSPLFAIGSVGTAMLGFPAMGYLMLLSNYISCLLMSFVLTPATTYPTTFRTTSTMQSRATKANIGRTLKDSIENALASSLSIGGYIVFFTVIIDIMNYNRYLDYFLYAITGTHSLGTVLKALLLGLIEITKGSQLISILNISVYLKSILISFLLGFSGLSIISQVYSFTYKFPEISMGRYIKRKALQGVFCSTTTALLIIPFNYFSTTMTFSQEYNISYIPLALLLAVLLIIPLIFSGLKSLLHIS